MGKLKDYLIDLERNEAKLTQKLDMYLTRRLRIELKCMYGGDVDCPCFGIETEMYTTIRRALDGEITFEKMLELVEKEFGHCESEFVSTVKKLISEEE